MSSIIGCARAEQKSRGWSVARSHSYKKRMIKKRGEAANLSFCYTTPSSTIDKKLIIKSKCLSVLFFLNH
jgi:hypothetical protein